jgi:hypothetical protein
MSNPPSPKAFQRLKTGPLPKLLSHGGPNPSTSQNSKCKNQIIKARNSSSYEGILITEWFQAGQQVLKVFLN